MDCFRQDHVEVFFTVAVLLMISISSTKSQYSAPCEWVGGKRLETVGDLGPAIMLAFPYLSNSHLMTDRDIYSHASIVQPPQSCITVL